MDMQNVTITAKIQLHSTDEQLSLLIDTARAYTKACNFVSKHIYKTHDLTMTSVNKALYQTIRKTFGLKSQMTQSAIKTVIARYKSLESNEHEWTNVVFHSYEYDLVWNRDYSLSKDGTFSLNTLSGRVKTTFDKLGMEQFFDGKWKFGTAKLVNKHGKLFLHVSVTKTFNLLTDSDVSSIVGVDRGIRFLVTSYDTNGKTTFYSGAQVKQKRAHYKDLRSELQRKQTSSARKRLKQIGQRENRWMRDVNHCVSKALVETNPSGTLFVLEDLTGIRAVTEGVRLKDRYVSVSWAYYDLEQKLKYKAYMHGDKVIKVNAAYTSQTCPECGHVYAGNRDKHNHIFKCRKCGYTSNDDRIGAMNLCWKGMEYLAESQNSISVL